MVGRCDTNDRPVRAVACPCHCPLAALEEAHRCRWRFSPSAERAHLSAAGADVPPMADNEGKPSNPPRWAPDPGGRHELRYWDGSRWSDHVSDAGRQGTDPLRAGGIGRSQGENDSACPPSEVTSNADSTGRQPSGVSSDGNASRGWPMSAKVATGALVLTLIAVAIGASGEPPAADSAAAKQITASDSKAKTAHTPERRSTTTSEAPTTTLAPATTTPPTTTIVATTLPPAAAPAAALTVARVIDGDTLDLSDGRRVRLAQVDAPERNECFGSQSTATLVELANGKSVELRRPPNGPEKDRYGRTLADVSVGGKSVNEALVRAGAAEWGDEYAREDADLASRLRAAEEEARSASRGLWSQCSAGAAPTSSPPTTQAASGGSNCHPAYPDDCIPPPPPDLDCGDIKRKVRVDHQHGDPHGFDGDGDGWGCQSYG